MGMGASIAITDSTGLLLHGGGFGWDFLNKDYQSFHDYMIARTISAGSPEVTAKITTLEDLQDVSPEFFDTAAKGGDAEPLRTIPVEEASLRKNLLPMESVAWPPLQDGPLEGAVTTEIIVDRTGKVRQVGSVVANNPGVAEVAKQPLRPCISSPTSRTDWRCRWCHGSRCRLRRCGHQE
jgi:hypothetical protein